MDNLDVNPAHLRIGFDRVSISVSPHACKPPRKGAYSCAGHSTASLSEDIDCSQAVRMNHRHRFRPMSHRFDISAASLKDRFYPIGPSMQSCPLLLFSLQALERPYLYYCNTTKIRRASDARAGLSGISLPLLTSPSPFAFASRRESP